MFLSHEELITQLCQHILFLQTTAQEIMFKILFLLCLQLGQMGQETKGWWLIQQEACSSVPQQAQTSESPSAESKVCSTVSQQSTCIYLSVPVFKSSESRTALSEPESSRVRT